MKILRIPSTPQIEVQINEARQADWLAPFVSTPLSQSSRGPNFYDPIYNSLISFSSFEAY